MKYPFFIRMSLLGLLAGLPAPAGAQRASLSTNLAGYLSLGTLNAEASYALQRHWTVTAEARYNPFTFPEEEGTVLQNRQRSCSAGVRFWPWHVYSGWWLSGRARCQEYHVGGLRSPRTREGDRMGAGLSLGYAHMLRRHFNLEFGVGAWAGTESYTIYDCPQCGMTVDSGRRTFLLPDDLTIAVSYVF